MDYNELDFEECIKFLASFDNVAFAIAHNKYLHDEIDKIYNENEIEYYKAYRKSSYYNNNYYSKLTVDLQDKATKVLGIMYYELEMNSFNNVITLIKKGYKPVISYLESNNILDIDGFLVFYSKKRNIKSQYFNSELAMGVIILCFLFAFGDVMNIRMNNIYDYKDSDSLRSILMYIINTTQITSLDQFESNDFPKLSTEIEKYLLNIGNNDINISNYIYNIFQAEGLQFKEKDEYKIRYLVNRYGLASKYVGMFTGLLRLLNIEPNLVMEKYKITKNEITDILKFANEKRDDVSEEELVRTVISYLFMKGLCNELSSTKELYFNNAKVKELEQYTIYQDKYKELKDKYIRENTKQLHINSELNNKVKELNSQISDMEREVKRLKLQLAESEYNKEELNKLREFVFKNQNQEDVECSDSIDINFLNSKNVLIVGGSPNWQMKMKEVLNNYKFVSVENMNFDVKIIDNVDLVIICTNYLNHGLYYKVINYARDNNIIVDYIGDNKNINLCLRAIGSIIKN